MKKQFNKKKAIRQRAFRLKQELKGEVMWAAREHMLAEKYPQWSMDEKHELLAGKTKEDKEAISQIWFEVVSRGSR